MLLYVKSLLVTKYHVFVGELQVNERTKLRDVTSHLWRGLEAVLQYILKTTHSCWLKSLASAGINKIIRYTATHPHEIVLNSSWEFQLKVGRLAYSQQRIVLFNFICRSTFHKFSVAALSMSIVDLSITVHMWHPWRWQLQEGSMKCDAWCEKNWIIRIAG